jgi:hypothetical protein
VAAGRIRAAASAAAAKNFDWTFVIGAFQLVCSEETGSPITVVDWRGWRYVVTGRRSVINRGRGVIASGSDCCTDAEADQTTDHCGAGIGAVVVGMTAAMPVLSIGAGGHSETSGYYRRRQ